MQRAQLPACGLLLAAGAILVSPLAGSAAQRDWANGDGQFDVASNWQGSVVPGSNDIAAFDLGIDEYTVTMPPPGQFFLATFNEGMRVGRDDVTLDLAGYSSYRLTGTGGDLIGPLLVGDVNSGSASLTLRNGTLSISADDGMFIGRSGGSNGAALTIERDATLDGGSGLAQWGFVTDSTVSIAGTARTPGGLMTSNDSDVTTRIDVRNGGVWESAGGSDAFGTQLSRTGTTELVIHDNGRAALGEIETAQKRGSRARIDVRAGGTLEASSAELGGDGDSDDGVATLNMPGGALADISGRLHVREKGTVNLGGGRINVGDVRFHENATFNFMGGRVHFPGDQRLGLSQLEGVLGAGATVTRGQHVSVGGTLTLDGPLTLDGGRLTAGSLQNGSGLDFQSGELTVKSAVQVGPNGALGAVMDLASDQDLRVVDSQTLTVGEGVLRIGPRSSVAADQVTNQGEIALTDSTARVDLTSVPGSVATLTNTGRLIGTGQVFGSVSNTTDGEVRATAGQRLVIGQVDNSGLINADDGRVEVARSLDNTDDGEVSVSGGAVHAQNLKNNAGATVSMTGGRLFVGGTLTNNGVVAIGPDDGRVHGTVDNTADTSASGDPSNEGRISVSGGGIGTFTGSVTNNGTVRVTGESKVLFLGDVSGNGNYPGPGEVEFASGFSPGNSPGEVSFGGDLTMRRSSGLRIELAGTTPGSQHDKLNVAGTFTQSGSLNVDLINGFQPKQGQSFDLFDFDAASGSFDSLELPGLDPGLTWITGKLDKTGDLAVLGLGDMNADGQVNNLDINPFVLALTDAQAFEAQFGFDPATVGDINGDGRFNNLDINPFVELLTEGGSLRSVPEPGSLALLGVGGLLLSGWRTRARG